MTLRADHPRARLQTMGPLKWQDVCVAPCQVPVNPVAIYRVGGGTIRPSDTFSLPLQSSVVIDAHVGSTIRHWVGVGLILGGVGAAVAGAGYYAAAGDATNSSGETGPKGALQTVGIVFIATGIILLAVGIPLSRSRTSVEVH